MLVFLLAFVAALLAVVSIFVPDHRLTASAVIVLAVDVMLIAYPHLGG